MSEDQARVCPVLVQTLSIVRDGCQFFAGHCAADWGSISQPQSACDTKRDCLSLARHQGFHISSPIHILSTCQRRTMLIRPT